ncbi:Hypothetical Protein FCC1311_112072 [Hondaea fermentalgiana]|uniref:Uncharacterized protein n=1 Tax=Hondaea fermentalgiana TaxID=2315210 RepID=A0A2R5GWM7_9STRA|nr:Hypothetical Protein FCC1311_112072 [Hondaea fermentalgiana]|eukprot:GBG34985.1 Hypothetical Protein FCC1311_112072 [Hondaea fermentalgiana]
MTKTWFSRAVVLALVVLVMGRQAEAVSHAALSGSASMLDIQEELLNTLSEVNRALRRCKRRCNRNFPFEETNSEQFIKNAKKNRRKCKKGCEAEFGTPQPEPLPPAPIFDKVKRPQPSKPKDPQQPGAPTNGKVKIPQPKPLPQPVFPIFGKIKNPPKPQPLP